ncbi:type I secretion system permease/ATPase [Devosia ginsengisoli]|uniref:Type I secretion system permease/ATPase n=1 Tax=Devosia ginsengisoli TaxID=400770 RepID=A0A5B8LTT5_9HYPH|nr:type I secretion system permease/ATPase [Devosia ginsengisoli]QDZ10700.1 type I secretion system permease/ATPase [Devosia ginsengisoli]
MKSIWSSLRVSQNVMGAFGLVMVFSIFVNLLILTSPIYMMQVYDRVLTTSRVETLIFLSLIAFAALAVLGLLDGVRSYLLTRLGRFLDLSLRDPVLTQAIAQSRRDGQNHRRLIDDLGTARNYLGSAAVLPFFDAPWVPFFILIMALLHPWLGVLALIAAIVLFGMALANDHFCKTPLRIATSQQIMASEFAGAALQNSEVIHAMGMQGAVAERYRQQVEQMGQTGQNAADMGATITAASKALRIAVQSAALGLGAYLVIRAELTPGGMIAGSIILGRALAPIEQSIGSWKQFVGARDAYKNIKGFLSSRPAEAERIAMPALKGRVSVENLSFSMPRAERPSLRRATFQLEPGTALALVGASASGKSTLCRLLVGAWQPTTGSVRIDGADIMTLNPTDIGATIGYMPQTVELFSGTVKSNIARLGAASDEAVIAAAKAAGCHEMILRLQDGYETELGPRGMFLSGGQRQRIGLARALFGDPQLIVLDEPNSNLDQDGELALVHAMRERKALGATIIVVSHRTSLLDPIDKIGVLRDGVLDQFGDRDEVLRDMAGQRAISRPTLVPSADEPKPSTGAKTA